MSDHLDPDDLASAALDDDVDPDERARIDADPALRARLGELADVRAMLAATPAPGAPAREAAIAAALDAFDELRAGASEMPAAITLPPAPVLSLVARRRVRWALSAAAAVVVVVGGAIALSQGRGDDTESAATAPAADAFEAPAERSQQPESAGDEAPPATDAATAVGAPSDLGEAPAVVADGDALDAQVLRNGDDLVRYAITERTAGTATGGGVSTDTQAPAATLAASDATFATAEGAPPAALLSCVLEAPFTDVVPVGPAQYNGVDVEVFRAVDTSLAGSPVVALAVDRFTCVVVDRQPIP
jgi:hypothetical protein